MNKLKINSKIYYLCKSLCPYQYLLISDFLFDEINSIGCQIIKFFLCLNDLIPSLKIVSLMAMKVFSFLDSSLNKGSLFIIIIYTFFYQL